MKKLILSIILVCNFCYSQERLDDKYTIEQKEKFMNAKSITKEIDGMFVFVNSIPVEKYKIVGDVIMNAIDSRKYKDQIYVLVNKAKKKFPNAHAVIISTVNDRFSAEVIEFNDLK